MILAKQLGRVNYYDDEKAAELIKISRRAGIRDVRLERGLENCDLCGNSLFREGYSATSNLEPTRVHPGEVRRRSSSTTRAAACVERQPSPTEKAIEHASSKMIHRPGHAGDERGRAAVDQGRRE